MNNEYIFSNEPPRYNETDLCSLLKHCSDLSASDITFQTNNQVYAEIHGNLYPVTARKLSHNEIGELLNILYGPNGTTQISSGKDVDTHFEIKVEQNKRIRFRINGTGCQVMGYDGIQITARTIPSIPPTLESMQLDEELRQHIELEQGLALVTGSTGSGKSTLLAAIIRHIAEDPNCNRKIITYESPIEFVYDEINLESAIISQSEIPHHLPSFAEGVRNALRRKPRLILVGEARDPETISAVIEAALTGHPVYTTLHSNGVTDAIRRMINTFPAEERNSRALDLIETTKLIIWQKLVPNKTGTRTALREYLVLNDHIRNELINTPVEKIANKTRELLHKYGNPISKEAKKYFEQGIIDDKIYNSLMQFSEMQDLDHGGNSK